MSLPTLHLVVLAGGRGERAADGDAVPKQFRATGRGLLLGVSVRTFLAADGPDPASLVVTVDPAWRDLAASDLDGVFPGWLPADPGATRTASTWNALQALAAGAGPEPGDLVAIHDAARPFATGGLLLRLAASAAVAGGAIPTVPVVDTVVRREGDRARYLDRTSLLGVQTPQVFRWDLLQEAHAWARAEGRSFTDDGGLLALRGHEPAVVEGEASNWKVTTADDWRRAEALLGS